MEKKLKKIKAIARRMLPLTAFLLLLLLITYGNIRVESINMTVQNYKILAQTSDHSTTQVVGGKILFYAKPGDSVTGGPALENKGDRAMEVNVILDGELADKGWISTRFPSFIIGPRQSRGVELELRLPEDAKGNYSGNLTLELR